MAKVVLSFEQNEILCAKSLVVCNDHKKCMYSSFLTFETCQVKISKRKRERYYSQLFSIEKIATRA